jgi:hypothetical protein
VDVVESGDRHGASVDDLELHPAARVNAARSDDRAQRTHEPPLTADHLADVSFGYVEPEKERAVLLFDLLDAHGVGLVYEPARELRHQFGHAY